MPLVVMLILGTGGGIRKLVLGVPLYLLDYL
jgi:hypothetical protein